MCVRHGSENQDDSMSGTPNDVSFAARHDFDRPLWRAAALVLPVIAGIVGTAIYGWRGNAVWGFLFVLWFVVLDLCLIGASMFRPASPPIASRIAYCIVALAGGALGAIEHNRWGGAVPILTMLVAVLVTLILEQLYLIARAAVRAVAGSGDRTRP
jgi:hypothetical protein